MPFRPVLVEMVPWITRLRSTTLSLAPALTITPLASEFRMPPALVPQSIVIDLVIVTAPNPPGSRQSISPPAAVLEMAPAKVLQGAVRLHGLASSPTPDTQVRVACACAGAAERKGSKSPRAAPNRTIRRISTSLFQPSFSRPLRNFPFHVRGRPMHQPLVWESSRRVQPVRTRLSEASNVGMLRRVVGPEISSSSQVTQFDWT